MDDPIQARSDVAIGRFDQFLGWVYGLPWWAPFLFALVATIVLMWVSWPRRETSIEDALTGVSKLKTVPVPDAAQEEAPTGPKIYTLPEDEQLTNQDFADFLGDKKINTICHRCGNGDWQTGHGDQIKGFVPIGTDKQGDFRESNRSIPVQYLICTNCGNIELFATKVVRRWKAARLKAFTEQGDG